MCCHYGRVKKGGFHFLYLTLTAILELGYRCRGKKKHNNITYYSLLCAPEINEKDRIGLSPTHME
jgi:hypothetical protein